MFKVGIIGTGWIAQKMVITLSSLEGYCVHAVGSRSKNSADSFAEKWNINRSYDSYEKLVEDEEIVKVHVHTANPGSVLEEAIKYGSLLTVKIENMRKQHSELSVSDASAPSFSKKYGFVAVANGDGICDVFKFQPGFSTSTAGFHEYASFL